MLAGTLRLPRQKQRAAAAAQAVRVAVPAAVAAAACRRCSQRRSSCGRAGRCRSIPAGWPLGLAAARGRRRLLRARARGSRSRSPSRSSRSGTSRSALALSTPCSRSLLARALVARAASAALLFALGPLLAPIAALACFRSPHLTIRSPRPARRAGRRGCPGRRPRRRHPRLAAAVRRRRAPARLGIAASGDPLAVLAALWEALAARPALCVETLVLAAVAALLPFARARGPWALADPGRRFPRGALLAAPTVAAAPHRAWPSGPPALGGSRALALVRRGTPG